METNIDGGVRQSPFALYRGSDFFESFIPSIWFLLGVVVVEVVFFRAGVVHDALERIVELRNAVAITSTETPITNATGLPVRRDVKQPPAPLPVNNQAPPSGTEPQNVSITLEILFAILLAVVAISLVFILGQVLNGVSASILDRLVVRKLLHYPFDLYQRWERNPVAAAHRVLKAAVLEGTYLVHCANLVPVLLFELTIASCNPMIFKGERHGVGWCVIVVLLTVAHLGVPAIGHDVGTIR